MSRMTAVMALLIAAAPIHQAAAQDVVVFAAASLKDALDAIGKDFSEQQGGDVKISYAGSGALAKQIIEGAPADIFISANTQWMDEVETGGMVVPDTRVDLLSNRLVLVAHGTGQSEIALGPETDVEALLDGGKLAMALVDAVPAGQYGKAALESMGLWDGLADNVAQADNVRSALRLVGTGEAPYGIVYASDAVAEDDVSVVATFPQDSHPPIIYPAALLTGGQDPADRAFLEHLQTPEAAEVFLQNGFSIAKPADG